MTGQRVVVTGGAGFLGSHLCRAMLARGDEVVAIDNLITGAMRKASPASPADFERTAAYFRTIL